MVKNAKKFTTENAREMARRSVEKRRELAKKRKSFQELATAILDIEIKPGTKGADKIIETADSLGIERPTIRQAMLISQIMRAIQKGDTKAFESVRDTAGEKPIERKQILERVEIVDDYGD